VGQPGDLTELQSRIQSLSASDKIKQIRNKMNETDWLFLNACMGIVNNDFAAVQSYLQATAGEHLRVSVLASIVHLIQVVIEEGK